MCMTSFTPPPLASAARSQIRYAHPISREIVANGCGYTQGPFWLPWRIALVGQENQIEDVRFFLSPLTTPPVVAAKTRVQRCLCREVDGIWQYRTGGNLTIFDKDSDTAEKGRSLSACSCSQAYSFATITMYSWWRFSGPAYCSEIFFFKGVKLVMHITVHCIARPASPPLWRVADSVRASNFA